MPKKEDLYEIVKGVVNENKTNFIYNNIFPKVEGESILIFTDRKWLMYILNQVISNAIKYNKSDGNITFVIEKNNENVVLKVIDKGIGIPQKDIERVFELFYTGSNGRQNVNSTGIGLAMVKRVANLLEHEVKLTSEIGVGTTFEIIFNR